MGDSPHSFFFRLRQPAGVTFPSSSLLVPINLWDINNKKEKKDGKLDLVVRENLQFGTAGPGYFPYCGTARAARLQVGSLGFFFISGANRYAVSQSLAQVRCYSVLTNIRNVIGVRFTLNSGVNDEPGICAAF